ncbi:MAG TPA: molybdopterin-dependent oxidoreductase [Longilinea sp.]|nr:molybdopterin-dependent oxidoreductase [Longilinea sp.]
MVNITIDGKAIEIPEGTTVLNAARSAGIEIPTLCAHPALTPYGGCRLCLVEVEGARTLQPSCTLPVNNGMVVHTDTEKVKSARKFVLTLIFSERNHFCPYCQVSGGDCELQNAAYHEDMTHWPLQPNWQPYPMDASHPYIILENNRCILCRRCVRACGELVGNFTLGFEKRGARSLLVADLGNPLGESTCVSCGVCVQVCPTGALIDRWSAYHGKETQVEKTETVCTGCSLGCTLEVLTRDNNLVRIEGAWDAPVNKGITCKVGRFLPLADERERLTTPLVRKNGALKAATWDEALEAIASHLKPLAGKIAALTSTRLSAESLYLFKQIFADHLKGEMVTTIEEGTATLAASTLADEKGKPFESKLETIQKADVVVLFNTDLVDEHEVAGFFVKRNIPNGTKVVVVDAQENKFSVLAEKTLKPVKASDFDAVEGLIATMLKMGVAKNQTTEPADKMLAARIEKTGMVAGEMEEAVKVIASAEHPVFVYGKRTSAEGLKAIAEFAGLVDAALVGVKGDANSLAAAQLGLEKTFKLDGHQAAYVALGDDQPSEQLLKKLEGVPFLVVQASYVSPATAMADVVLPVGNWMEQDGHYLSLEGKLQEAHKALKPAEDILSNEAALQAVAKKLDVKANDQWKKALTQRVSPVEIEL